MKNTFFLPHQPLKHAGQNQNTGISTLFVLLISFDLESCELGTFIWSSLSQILDLPRAGIAV